MRSKKTNSFLATMVLALAISAPASASTQRMSAALLRQAEASFKQVFDDYGEKEESTDYGGSILYRTYIMKAYDGKTRNCRYSDGRLAIAMNGVMTLNVFRETYSNGRPWPRPGDGTRTYEARYDVVYPVDSVVSGNTVRLEFDTSDLDLDWRGDLTRWVSEVYDRRLSSALRNRAGASMTLSSSDQTRFAARNAFSIWVAADLRPC